MTPQQRNDWRLHVIGSELSANQKIVLLALETFADYTTGRNARPGEKRLAQLCGLTTRSVWTALDRGRALGLIEQTAPANSRRALAAVYRLVAVTPTTGSQLPVDNLTTGSQLPVHNSTTGSPVHHDRKLDDTTTGSQLPPTSSVPLHYQGVSPSGGTSPEPRAATPTHTDRPPSRFCSRHPHGYAGACGNCANARTAFTAWQAATAEAIDGQSAVDDLEGRRRRRQIASCPDCCDDYGRRDDGSGERLIPCEHPRLDDSGTAHG